MKRFGVLAVLALAIASLVGCGGGQGETEPSANRPLVPRELRLTFDGYASPANVAILMAQERGFFEAAGLQITAANPLAPRRSVPYVVNGTDDLGLAQEPQVAIAKGKGAPVVAVGSVVAEPTAALIWLRKSRIHALSDLKGKTIAVSGVPWQEEALRSVLAHAGMTLDDVDVRTVGYELVPSLLKVRADAIFGGTWNIEGVELEERGAKPVVKRVGALGVPPYEELVVVARTDLVAKQPRAIRAFTAAVAKGAAAAVEDPQEAVELIENSPWRNPDTGPKTLRAQVAATLPLLSTSGMMNSERARDLVEWMEGEGMLEQPFPPQALLSNSDG